MTIKTLPLTPVITSRDATLQKDSKIVNGYVEANFVIKRPGVSLFATPVTEATPQLLAIYDSNIITVQNNILYTTTDSHPIDTGGELVDIVTSGMIDGYTYYPSGSWPVLPPIPPYPPYPTPPVFVPPIYPTPPQEYIKYTTVTNIIIFYFEGYPQYPAAITTNTITVYLPIGTNLTHLTPVFETPAWYVTAGGSTVISGNSWFDYTTPQTLTVVAPDGTEEDYTVEVHNTGILYHATATPTAIESDWIVNYCQNPNYGLIVPWRCNTYANALIAINGDLRAAVQAAAMARFGDGRGVITSYTVYENGNGIGYLSVSRSIEIRYLFDNTDDGVYVLLNPCAPAGDFWNYPIDESDDPLFGPSYYRTYAYSSAVNGDLLYVYNIATYLSVFLIPA